MKPRKLTLAAAAIFGAAMLIAGVRPSLAQDDPKPKSMTLWVDPGTGQLFTRPGRGRKPFVIPSAAGLDTGAIESHVEEKVEQKTQQSIEQSHQDLKAELAKTQQQNQDLTQQMAEIRPAWKDYVDNFKNKFRVGTVVYADWRLYSHTGFGPQETENVDQPGPGNNAFNSFDISRAYLNFYFNPTDDWTVRMTPDIYQTQVGTVNPTSFGANSAINSNLAGNMAFRIKYAYLQYGKAFDRVEPLKGDTITAGAIPNAFIPWQEDLVGFRFVGFDSPWNYYSLSSSQLGLSMQGPIKFNGLQYVDYDLGVYNDANFHQFESSSEKQVMGRVSIYPFGAQWRFDGLGLTGVYDYAYSNSVAPDQFSKGAGSPHIMRAALMAHYTAEQWGLGGEYDFGHNAFSANNLFSGSGPSDAFTGGAATSFANFTKMTKALLNNGRAVERGIDFWGHVHIPETPFTAIGMFSMFQPNTKVDLNPLDFQRWLAGVTYQYNEFLRFALTSQNLLYYHKQGNFPESEANFFTKGTFSSPGTATIKDAVPRDNHSLWLSMEFAY